MSSTNMVAILSRPSACHLQHFAGLCNSLWVTVDSLWYGTEPRIALDWCQLCYWETCIFCKSITTFYCKNVHFIRIQLKRNILKTNTRIVGKRVYLVWRRFHKQEFWCGWIRGRRWWIWRSWGWFYRYRDRYLNQAEGVYNSIFPKAPEYEFLWLALWTRMKGAA